MSDRSAMFAGEDPFTLLGRWLEEARGAELNDPEAMSLATVDPDGLPNVRVVLLKGIDPDGLVFFTNYESVKGRELDAAGKAAIVLHWKSLRRQVRARGIVERLSAEPVGHVLRESPAAIPARRMGLATVPTAAIAGPSDGRGGQGDGAKRREPVPPTVLGRL